jgi:hypothetical protein
MEQQHGDRRSRDPAPGTGKSCKQHNRAEIMEYGRSQYPYGKNRYDQYSVLAQIVYEQIYGIFDPDFHDSHTKIPSV